MLVGPDQHATTSAKRSGMTSAHRDTSSSILSVLEELSATWRWGGPPTLLTISHRPPKPTVPAILASGVDGDGPLDLLARWIDQCRRHRGIVHTQRDLGVDAVAVSGEIDGQYIGYAMDRNGREYLVRGQRRVPGRCGTSGTDVAARTHLPDLLTERLAELVWRLAGPPPAAAGSRIRDMWPVAGLIDLDEDELHERYALPSHTEGHVRLVTVSSLDGLAAVNGSSTALTSSGDQRVYRLIKRDADLLLLGAATIRAEQYGQTALSAPEIARRRANGLPPYPVVAVVTRSLDLDLRGPLFQRSVGGHSQPRPLLIIPAAAAPKGGTAIAEAAEFLVAGEHDVDLNQAIQVLQQRGHRRIVCEGGPALAGQLARADLLDEICMTISPQLLAVTGPRITAGPAGQPADGQWQLRRSLLDERGNLFLRYARPGPADRQVG
ncbi:dihydrofolate reductase family protein [Salinispora fenicalii]|uniref:dihydrofolate reductase family protein n=1 Tax=Salinispora fenicalii TaxID=1137263 RepID=UPI000487EE37|nr:dihydrofolate reductase family protein [Salinispora fenicalii]